MNNQRSYTPKTGEIYFHILACFGFVQVHIHVLCNNLGLFPISRYLAQALILMGYQRRYIRILAHFVAPPKTSMWSAVSYVNNDLLITNNEVTVIHSTRFTLSARFPCLP